MDRLNRRRFFPFIVLAGVLAGLAGYLAGSAAPARADTKYEYKVFAILQFDIQGAKIDGEEWVKPSHLDLPHKKVGDALLKDRAIMTKTLNAMAHDGWEPVMIYQSAIVARRPAGN
jgi:hypothetical protein